MDCGWRGEGGKGGEGARGEGEGRAEREMRGYGMCVCGLCRVCGWSGCAVHKIRLAALRTQAAHIRACEQAIVVAIVEGDSESSLVGVQIESTVREQRRALVRLNVEGAVLIEQKEEALEEDELLLQRPALVLGRARSRRVGVGALLHFGVPQLTLDASLVAVQHPCDALSNDGDVLLLVAHKGSQEGVASLLSEASMMLADGDGAGRAGRRCADEARPRNCGAARAKPHEPFGQQVIGVVILEHDVEGGLRESDAAEERIERSEEVDPDQLTAHRQYLDEHHVEQQIDDDHRDAIA